MLRRTGTRWVRASKVPLAVSLYRATLKATLNATFYYHGNFECVWRATVGVFLNYSVAQFAFDKARLVAEGKEETIKNTNMITLRSETDATVRLAYLAHSSKMVRPFFTAAAHAIESIPASNSDERKEAVAAYAKFGFAALTLAQNATFTPEMMTKFTLSEIVIGNPSEEFNQLRVRALFARDGTTLVPVSGLMSIMVEPFFPVRVMDVVKDSPFTHWAAVVEGAVCECEALRAEHNKNLQSAGGDDAQHKSIVDYDIRDDRIFDPMARIFNLRQSREAALEAVIKHLPTKRTTHRRFRLELWRPKPMTQDAAGAATEGKRRQAYPISERDVGAERYDTTRALIDVDVEIEMSSEYIGAAPSTSVSNPAMRFTEEELEEARSKTLHHFKHTIVVRNRYTPPAEFPKSKVHLQLMGMRVVVSEMETNIRTEFRGPTFYERFVSVPPDGSTVALGKCEATSRFGNILRGSVPILMRFEDGTEGGEATREKHPNLQPRLIDLRTRVPMVEVDLEAIALNPK